MIERKRPSLRSPFVLVLCGPSHSGKSSYVNTLKNLGSLDVISLDSLSKKVFLERKKQAIRQKRSFVLDACHTTIKERRESLSGIPRFYRKFMAVFDLPWHEVELLATRTDRLPLRIVKKTWEKFKKNKPKESEINELKRKGVSVTVVRKLEDF